MPNYIKNRIELIGTEKEIAKVLKKFSTHFERAPNKSFDGRLIYVTTNDNYRVGWLDEKTGEFEERDRPKTKDIPKEFKQDFNEAWVRFPDFGKIIPMPESLNIENGTSGEMDFSMIMGASQSDFMSMEDNVSRFYDMSLKDKIKSLELGIKYAKNVKEYGHTTWYEWCSEKWGTKWNSSSCEELSKNLYEFQTAWSGVPGLIKKMSLEFPEVKFLYEWSDENTGSNCGFGMCLNGEAEFRQLENESTEAYELAFKLRPDSKEYYKLVDGAYEYIEEGQKDGTKEIGIFTLKGADLTEKQILQLFLREAL